MAVHSSVRAPKAVTASRSADALGGFTSRLMEKMGGWKNWDQTRYITWKFFGRRLHVWDKWTGNIRFENKDIVVLMNIHNQEGRVWRAGVKMTEPDSLKKYLRRGYRAWINDSYWLVMPY